MEILSFIFQGIFTVILWSWWILVPILGIAAWQNFRKARWAEKQEHILLRIKIPKSNDKDPKAAEMMFAALHGILRPSKDKTKEGSLQEYLSFEMVANTNAINFYVGVPLHLRDYVEGQIYAQYPSAELSEAEDYSKDLDVDDDGIRDDIACAELRLKRDYIIPIKTFESFTVDPLAGITSALAKLDGERDQVWIQMLIRPVADKWQKKSITYIQEKKSGKISLKGLAYSQNLVGNLLLLPFKLIAEVINFMITAGGEGEGAKKAEAPKLAPDVESSLTAIEEKASKLGFEVKIRVMSIASNKISADQKLQAAIGAFKQFNTINLNSIVSKRFKKEDDFLNDFQSRAFYDKGFIFNISELASIYHLPHTSVETPNINWTSSKTGEPPIDLPTIHNTDPQDLTLFAETNFRHRKIQFGIKIDDRRRHTYIIGKSGMGKSKLLEKMMEEDIEKGHGFAVIDPNGDLILDALKKIPEERIKDVILLDPSDQEFPIAFNPLEVEDETLKHFVAQGFVGILAKLFGHSWGPRLEYILNYTILALLDYPDSTVLGIVRMLTDKNFRKKVVKEIKDPVVKKFWTTEFASYNEKFATEAVAPILNKVGQFTASSMIRNIIGQPKSSFDMRKAMDTNKILLINLSTGKVGEVNSSLLGGMIITKIQLAAMSRASQRPEDRVDFILYVDEFQHFATESFATILSEARKYKLSLIVANQYIAQMEETVRDAVFGNVGTMITFKVGAADADVLQKELNPPFEVGDIINLDRQQIYLKITLDGKTTIPFSAKTLDIAGTDRGNSEEIIRQSREKYSNSRKEVEDAINKWSNVDMEEGEDSSSENTPTPSSTPPSTGGSSSFAAPIVSSNKQESSSGFQAPIVNKPTTNTPTPEKAKEEKTTSNNTPSTSVIKDNNNEQAESSSSTKKRKRKKKKNSESRVDTDKIKEALRQATKTDTTENRVVAVKGEGEALKSPQNKPKEPTTDKTNVDKDVLKKVVLKALEPKVKTETKREDKFKENPNPRHLHRREEKTEKVVTPDNVKEIKEIKPNEKVIINKETHELKQGEQVIFKKDESKD